MEAQFDAVQSLKAIEANYGPQIAREVVEIFVKDYPGKIKKLQAAIEEGNAQTIRFVAHDIKSGCLSMGVQPMSFLCEKIEHEGVQLPKEELTRLAAELQEQYQRISRDYSKYLNVAH
jgi:HPt (histidine-containing phosphotransfer) domain-containing protein